MHMYPLYLLQTINPPNKTKPNQKRRTWDGPDRPGRASLQRVPGEQRAPARAGPAPSTADAPPPCRQEGLRGRAGVSGPRGPARGWSVRRPLSGCRLLPAHGHRPPTWSLQDFRQWSPDFRSPRLPGRDFRVVPDGRGRRSRWEAPPAGSVWVAGPRVPRAPRAPAAGRSLRLCWSALRAGFAVRAGRSAWGRAALPVPLPPQAPPPASRCHDDRPAGSPGAAAGGAAAGVR